MFRMNRAGFGMALVVAFSFGLAGVLLGVGLLFVKGGRMLDRVPMGATAVRVFPALSALFIAVLGVALAAGALQEVFQ